MAMPEHIGGGLAVNHEYSEAIRPIAVREGPKRYRGEISGVVAGSIVRRWRSEVTHATSNEALQEALSAARMSPSAGGNPHEAQSPDFKVASR